MNKTIMEYLLELYKPGDGSTEPAGFAAFCQEWLNKNPMAVSYTAYGLALRLSDGRELFLTRPTPGQAAVAPHVNMAIDDGSGRNSDPNVIPLFGSDRR